MKYFTLIATFFLSILFSYSIDFDQYFIDKTLRIDYSFSGNSEKQSAYLSQLSQLPQWAGRRSNLSEVLREGNGQVKVTDLRSGRQRLLQSFVSSLTATLSLTIQ